MKFKYKLLLGMAFVLFVYGFLTEEKTRRLFETVTEYLSGSTSMWISLAIVLYLLFRFRDKIIAKYLGDIFELIQPLFPKKAYILFDNLYENNAECIDTFCVFNYMQEKNIESYYVIWKKNPMYEKLKSENRLKNIIALKKSAKHDEAVFLKKTFWKLLRTKAVITSFGGLMPRVTSLLFKNEYIEYIHINHGPTFLKEFVLSTPYLSPQKYNKFLVSNNEEEDIFAKYGWEKKNLIKIGLPRWDLLKKEKNKAEKIIFYMPTWRLSFEHGNKKAYPYELKDSKYFKGIEAFLKSQKLRAILQENNIKIVLSLHHMMFNQKRELPEIKGVEIIETTEVSKWIPRADLFVTDYSSIFFDFLYIKTPVIFYRPDFDDFELVPLDRRDMENAQSKDDLLFNVCYDLEKTIDLIEHYTKNGFVLEDECVRKAANLFPEHKNIRQRFVEYLESSDEVFY